MKKLELKNLTEYFGNQLPAGRIKNRDTRIAVVLLYGSLAKANMAVVDEVEQVRLKLIEGHEQEIEEYSRLVVASQDPNKTEQERKELLDKAKAMEECERINNDYKEAADKIYGEECEPELKKISLEYLYDALSDCGFPNIGQDAPISIVQNIFNKVIE